VQKITHYSALIWIGVGLLAGIFFNEYDHMENVRPEICAKATEYGMPAEECRPEDSF
jgi:hypothetical protein